MFQTQCSVSGGSGCCWIDVCLPDPEATRNLRLELQRSRLRQGCEKVRLVAAMAVHQQSPDGVSD